MKKTEGKAKLALKLNDAKVNVTKVRQVVDEKLKEFDFSKRKELLAAKERLVRQKGQVEKQIREINAALDALDRYLLSGEGK